MKILIYANYLAVYEGNFISSLKVLENKFREKQIQVIWCFPIEAERLDWVQNMKKTRKIYFLESDIYKGKKSLKKMVEKEKIDIIYAHFINLKEKIMFMIIQHKYKIKCITHEHNHIKKNKCLKKKIKMFIERKFIHIGCSKDVEQDMLAYGIKKENVTYVENAIQFERLEKWEKLKNSYYNIPENAIKILMFGGGYYRKGVDIAIGAINKLNSQKKLNIYLLIVCSGGQDEIKSTIYREYGKIEWIRVIKAREDVATYYKFADIFISPSREEGFCYSLIEAAYCGCKVIGSRIPAQRDLKIPDIEWFESENIEELCKKIIFSINKERDNRIPQIVKENYNIDTWANDIMNILI